MDMTSDLSLQESCMAALRHMGVEVRALVGKTNELENENAKLRELVRDMWNGMCVRAECRHCEHYKLKDGQRFVGECEFHRRMREFGIEVDG